MPQNSCNTPSILHLIDCKRVLAKKIYRIFFCCCCCWFCAKYLHPKIKLNFALSFVVTFQFCYEFLMQQKKKIEKCCSNNSNNICIHFTAKIIFYNFFFFFVSNWVGLLANIWKLNVCECVTNVTNRAQKTVRGNISTWINSNNPNILQVKQNKKRTKDYSNLNSCRTKTIYRACTWEIALVHN